MNRSVFFNLLLLGGWIFAPLTAALALGTGAEPTIHKTCIDEPIFGQRACIYEANRQAAQTIVMVHGLNGQALRDWGKQIQPLARRYHVMTFDLPGFGASDRGSQYYSPATYARFIRYITERYVKRPFHLMGHSMGGAIVLRYSADYPQDVDRLILVDVAGVLHRMAYVRILAAAWVGEHVVSDSPVGGFLDRMTSKFITKVEGIAGLGNEYLAKKLIEHELVDAPPPVVAAFTLANEDLSDVFRKIRVPVMMLWGEEDKVAPLRTATVLKARLPQAKLVTFAGAGHSPMSDVPESFNGEVLAFLSAALPELSGGVDEGQSRPLQGQGEVECRSQRGKVYEGYFERIVLEGCSGVVIRNATVGSVQARSSIVDIENSVIGGAGDNALTVVGSELTVTGGEISGRVPIHASRSRLDLAGVSLIAGESAVSGDSGSSLIFSVSELRMNGNTDTLHGYFEVDRNHPLTNTRP